MDLCEFRDRVYGKYKGNTFLFEPSWDCFRPIDGLVWDGTDFTVLDAAYKQDLLSDTYGYGSAEMKQVCKRLIETTELEQRVKFTDPVQVWRFLGQTQAEWWRDRPCVFKSKCVSRDVQSWKKFVGCVASKPRTLRHSGLHRIATRKKRLV
jgi:hypothetical protein